MKTVPKQPIIGSLHFNFLEVPTNTQAQAQAQAQAKARHSTVWSHCSPGGTCTVRSPLIEAVDGQIGTLILLGRPSLHYTDWPLHCSSPLPFSLFCSSSALSFPSLSFPLLDCFASPNPFYSSIFLTSNHSFTLWPIFAIFSKAVFLTLRVAISLFPSLLISSTKRKNRGNRF